MKIKSIVLSLFCLSALALGAELMSQQDLQATWFKDNPNYKVEFSAEKCTAACLKNERRALAVQSRSITGVKPGETFKVSFLARGTVNNLEFFPQSNGKNCSDQQGLFRVFDDWNRYEATFTIPEDCKTFSCVIYAWNQEGFFEIREFSIRPSTAETDNQAAGLDTQKITINGTSDKVLYEPGEQMKFLIEPDFGGQSVPSETYSVKWQRTGEDGKRATGKEPFTPGKPVVIKTSLDTPGFVRIVAYLADGKGRIVQKKNQAGRPEDICFIGGAGVQPEKLQPAAEEPADFDAFWAKQKAKLAAIPVKYKMDQVGSSKNVDIYAVSVDCAGPRPVTGYLTVPVGAKEKSLPAYVSYHGYGTNIQVPPKDGPGNRLRFDVNAHGYELGKGKGYYDDFFAKIKSNGAIYAFDPKQNFDPETAYFNGMALRVMRSLEFIKQLPQWNGRVLSASGASQGGLQTIWAAALDPDVTDAVSIITWCCDLAGPARGRPEGWRPAYVPALNYYDAVFHAKRVKCPVDIARAGLGDDICPPSGLAILYNNLGSAKKKISWVQGSTHGFVPEKAQSFLVEQK